MIKIRCFMAADLNSEGVRSTLRSVQEKFPSKGLKKVNPEILHLTFNFLGEITAKQVAIIKHAFKSFSFEPFSISLQGLGCFPSISRPRVIWVGVKEGLPELLALNQRINAVFAENGFAANTKFKPHITLARVKFADKNIRIAIRDVLIRYKDEEFGMQLIEAVELKESTLTPKGPIYTTIERFPSNVIH